MDSDDWKIIIVCIFAVTLFALLIYCLATGIPAYRCDKLTVNIDLPNRVNSSTGECQVKYNGEWVNLSNYKWAVEHKLIPIPVPTQ